MSRNKRLVAIVCVMTLGLSLVGCGSRKAIDDYPGMVPGDGSESEVVSEEGSIAELAYSEGKVSYIARGQRGEDVYKVNADIVGNPSDTYPVYDIKFWDMRSQDLYNLSAFIVGARDAEYLLPLDIADEDYLNNRLDTLEKRRDKLLEKGKEATHAITTEIEAIERELSKPDLATRFTVPAPTVAQLVDLHDYYLSEYGVETDLQFCFSENVDPAGNVIRLDVFKYHGNISLKCYYEDYNYSDSNNYYLGSSEQDLPVSFDKINKSECEALAMNFIESVGIGGLTLTNTYPACDYGAYTDESGTHAYEKPAYCCFFSLDVNDRVRPANSVTDTYSNNITETRPLITADNVTTIFSGGEDSYTYNGYSIPASDAAMYDSFCVCVGADDRPIEVLSTNILEDIEMKTEKAKLLSFNDIDACAQKYLAYLAAHDTEGYERTIDRIELGMCRAIGEKGNLFMVPAWYYMLSTEADKPLPEPVMAVNAIDGSIIDVKAGGATVTF